MITDTYFNNWYKGKVFGKLRIIDKAPGEKDGHVLYCMAKCLSCGNIKKMIVGNIVYGASQTCGCGRILALSIAKRNGFKLTVRTPEGPKSLKWLATQYGQPYARIYARYTQGSRTVDELLGKTPRKLPPPRPDARLNGLTQKEVTKMFGLKRQTVSDRLKRGWTLNKESEWVSPTRGNMGSKVQRMSKKAEKKVKKARFKRNFLNKLYE